MSQLFNIIVAVTLGLLTFWITKQVGLKKVELSDWSMWNLFFPSHVTGYISTHRLGTLPQYYRVVGFLVAMLSLLVVIVDKSATFPSWWHAFIIGSLLGTIVYLLNMVIFYREVIRKTFLGLV